MDTLLHPGVHRDYGRAREQRFAGVAQWTEQSRPKGKVGGSIPLTSATNGSTVSIRSPASGRRRIPTGDTEKLPQIYGI